jgi:hypothetical protein
VGALGHYLEEAGIPTSQISLIREHSERLRPPRALWVPFDFGRPLGVPHDASFQTRVLSAALRLLEAPSGPVLEEFPEEAPGESADLGVWACPIPSAPSQGVGSLVGAFREEFARLRPWYSLSVGKQGRTTVGLSELSLEEIVDFLPRFLDQEPPPSPREDLPLMMALKHAAEDLRAAYGEAATAQPGARPPTAEELNDWFWNETRAAELYRAIRAKLADSTDRGLKLVATLMLVPVGR